MNQIINHLWQSTVFTVVIAVAAVALRRNSPRLRYWLWLAASMKFLIPFSLIESTGARLPLPPETLAPHAATVGQISMYFEPVSEYAAARSAGSGISLGAATLAAVWLTGICLLFFRWFRRWRTINRAVRGGVPLPFPCSVPVFSSSAMVEPG